MSGGYCQVNPHGVNVLAETAERPEDIDIERAQAALSVAQERLRQADIGVDLLEKYQAKMNRATTRKEVAAHAQAPARGEDR